MATDSLPPGLPEPVDDGAADHLPGMALPDLALQSTSGSAVNLSRLQGRTIVYLYPMSGDDDEILPHDWDSIPGARGCTPQHCNMRDHHDELAGLGALVFGMATQSPSYLKREVARLHLPYELLSDEQLEFARAMRLPFLEVEVGGKKVLKRITLVLRGGAVETFFYPVFPPDRAAVQVIQWLRATGESPEPR